MSVLDIAPLRSLVAIADCGGVQRAATHLHLSQGAVSQHLRRLEAAVGRNLMERHGRGSRFTGDGEQLLNQARQILALDDETLQGFGSAREETITVGCTEHAAAQLLPPLSTVLAAGARVAGSHSGSTAGCGFATGSPPGASTWPCCSARNTRLQYRSASSLPGGTPRRPGHPRHGHIR
jgi:molybdenum-dependent DNA-binding transcriptional regulator ModE